MDGPWWEDQPWLLFEERAALLRCALFCPQGSLALEDWFRLLENCRLPPGGQRGWGNFTNKENQDKRQCLPLWNTFVIVLSILIRLLQNHCFIYNSSPPFISSQRNQRPRGLTFPLKYYICLLIWFEQAENHRTLFFVYNFPLLFHKCLWNKKGHNGYWLNRKHVFKLERKLHKLCQLSLTTHQLST